jgi:hypothetical protein
LPERGRGVAEGSEAGERLGGDGEHVGASV